MESHAVVRGESPVGEEEERGGLTSRASDIQLMMVTEMDDDSSSGVRSKGVPMSQLCADGSIDDRIDDDEDVGRRGPIRRRWNKCKMPSNIWTARHSLYCGIVGSLLPTMICFAVNFGVATALFRGNPPPTMWAFPVPLAGDFAAIILVQTIINYPLFGTLSTFDILNGLAPPLLPSAMSLVEMDTETYLGWLLQPPELFFPPIKAPDKQVKGRIADTLKRIGAWFVLAFIPLWPLFTGITYAIWGLDGYNSYPQPEFIAATLGGVLAFATCPVWTLVTLLNLGKRIQLEESLLANEVLFLDLIPPPSPKT